MNLEHQLKISEAISESFAIEDEVRVQVNKFMKRVKAKVKAVKGKVKLFATALDRVLDDVITCDVEPPWSVTLKLAFQMNRCEQSLTSL